MYELFVKDKNNVWQVVELGQDPIATNIQRNDISELKDRQNDYTRALKIPPTPKNCKTFDYIHDFTTISDLRKRRMDCRLYAEGFKIIGDGGYLKFFQVNSNFEVQLVGGTQNFYNTISENNGIGEQKTLNDLSFTEKIIRGLTGFQVSNDVQTNLRSSFFAVADFAKEAEATYSFNKFNKQIQQQAQVPFVRYKDIIERIVTDAGYTLDTNLTENMYTKACIPFNHMKPDMSYFNNSKISSVRQTTVNTSLGLVSGCSVTNPQTGLLPVNTYGVGWSLPNYPAEMFIVKFTSPVTGYYTFKLHINMWYMLGMQVNDATDILFQFNPSSEIPWSIILDQQITVHINEGEYIMFTARQRTDNSIIRWCDITLLESRIDDNTIAPIGLPVPIKTNLPNITQFDYFKSFINMYGLTVDIDEKSKIVKAYTFKKIIENKPLAKDWSKKYNDNSGNEKFVLGSYAKRNALKFLDQSIEKDNTSAYTQLSEGLAKYLFNKGYQIYYSDSNNGGIFKLFPFDYGKAEYWIANITIGEIVMKSEGFIDINNENLEKYKELLTFPFEANENIRTSGVPGLYYYAKIKWLEQGEFKPDSPSKFLMFTGSDNVTITNDDGVVLGGCTLPIVSSVNYANGESVEAQALVNKYYAEFMSSVLSDVRVIEDAVSNLTPQDIEEYNPFIPVYIDKFGAYFYVNKIKNFVSGRLTKCDLVKI